MAMTATPASVCSGVDILDRPLPVPLRALVVFLFALIPLLFFFKQFANRADLTQIIQFGEVFQPRALPEVRALKPDIHSLTGYDGQFYAQISLDPTLRRPDLAAALDDPGGRMQRPLLPALAYLLGAGRPGAILFAYALLNLGFWFLLLGALVRSLPTSSLRGFLVLFAILFSMGTLSSLECALTDLPAATLGFLGLIVSERCAAPFLALGMLTKPTIGLFLLRYAAPGNELRRRWKYRAALCGLSVVPLALWQLYLLHLAPPSLAPEGRFGTPFVEWWHHLATSFSLFVHDPYPKLEKLPWRSARFEFLSTLSLTLQAAFLLARPHRDQPAWWVGVGFAVLFFCLGFHTGASELTYARTVLPLTFIFNLQLAKMDRTWSFLTLYVLGNAGLLDGLCETYRFLAS